MRGNRSAQTQVRWMKPHLQHQMSLCCLNRARLNSKIRKIQKKIATPPAGLMSTKPEAERLKPPRPMKITPTQANQTGRAQMNPEPQNPQPMKVSKK